MSPTAGRGGTHSGSDYSFLRLIEGIRRDGRPQDARYELGLSDLQRGRGGIELAARPGSPLPDQELLRDLVGGAASAGGNLIASGLESVVAATRPTLVLEELGAKVMNAPGVGQLSLPVWSGDLGANSWIAENGAAATFAGLQVRSVSLVPHAAAARCAYSRRAAAAAAQAIEPALLAELRRAVRAVVERGCIAGTGSANQPLGLENTPGKQSITFAASTPTNTELAAMVEAAGDNNADLSSCAFLLHPSTLTTLLRSQAAAGTGGEMVVQWSDGAHRIHGFRVESSTHVTEGRVLFADFSKVLICYFGAPFVIADTFTAGKSITGDCEVVLINYMDACITDPSQLVLGSP